MKKFYSLICGLLFFSIIIDAQTVSTISKGNSVHLSVIVEDMVEPFPSNARVQIINKLTNLITQNGIVSTDYLSQFFITAIAVPQQTEVLNTVPVQIAKVIDFTLYIGDLKNQMVFSQITIPARGVGTNESKCYMDAIHRINLNSRELKQFVTEGRNKIVDYYNNQAKTIMLQAKHCAAQKDYEQAIFLLTSIPSECSAYSQALELTDRYYQMYIDEQCNVNLSKARMEWMAQQNVLGAQAAGEYLVNIMPDAACYADAMQLYKEIKGKVLDDWKFEMKKYQDQIDLERLRIEAINEIGVAYGKNQQPVTTNIGFLR